MLSIPSALKIYLAAAPTDMRKSHFVPLTIIFAKFGAERSRGMTSSYVGEGYASGREFYR